jgi:hypothetical protein
MAKLSGTFILSAVLNNGQQISYDGQQTLSRPANALVAAISSKKMNIPYKMFNNTDGILPSYADTIQQIK